MRPATQIRLLGVTCATALTLVGSDPRVALAQTAATLRQTTTPSEALRSEQLTGGQGRSTSAVNPWVLGTELGTQFYGDEGLNDDLLVAAKFVHPVVTGTTWELATFGNFASFTDSFDGLDEDGKSEAVANLLSSSRGLLIGTQLYRRVAVPNTNWLQIVPFGQLDFRLSRAKTTDTAATGAADDKAKAETLLQRRAGFGLEAHIGNQGEGQRPLTVSFQRTRTWADSSEFAAVFGNRAIPRYVNEYTAILPVNKKFGIVASMTRGEKSRDVFRVSLLVVTGGGDDAPGENEESQPESQTEK